MILSERYDVALTYAVALHRRQLRTGTGIPYVSHLLSVSALVLEYGGDEDQAIAALLHDAAEDCGGEARLQEIRERFGDRVAQIVADCTDSWTDPKPDWAQRKIAYVAELASRPPATLLVSLADKTHNATAILQDYLDIGEALWERFSGGRDGTLWYYRALADRFAAAMPGNRLAQRFGAVVAALEAEVRAREGWEPGLWQPAAA
jgi:(p)ppGpp synthase/HD superfamily hydrolase